MRPNQNVGIEIPRTELLIIIFDPHPLGFKPAYTPKGNPTVTAIISAQVASSSVAGNLSAISESAGLPKIKELPKSPDNAPCKNFHY